MVHRFEGEVGFGADLQHQRERHINLGGADFRAESDLDFWNWVYNDFREECQPPPPTTCSFLSGSLGNVLQKMPPSGVTSSI